MSRTIAQSDIDRLATKLDSLGNTLDETEKSVLLGVFGLAASNPERIEASGSSTNDIVVTRGDAPLPALSRGFQAVFQPAAPAEVAGYAMDEADSVGVSVSWSR